MDIGSKDKLITAICTICADGTKLSPFIIYPGIRHTSTIEESISIAEKIIGMDIGISKSESGWTNDAIAVKWLEKIFIPAVATRNKPVILFLDGHHSHVTLEFLDKAEAMGVFIHFFPSHTTHLLQPLDVAVFGPFKVKLGHLIENILQERAPNGVITKDDFPVPFAHAFVQAFGYTNIVNGFYTTGTIYSGNQVYMDTNDKIRYLAIQCSGNT